MAWTDTQQDGLIATLLQRVASLETSSGSSSGSSGTVTEDDLSDYADMLSEYTYIANALVGYLGTNDCYTAFVGNSSITADNAWRYWCGAVNYALSTLDANKLEAADLNRTNLEDVVEDIIGDSLELETLLADYIKATDIVTGTLTASTLLSRTAEFLNLITTTVTAEGVQAFTIDSDHVTFNDACITNAMIQSINAGKITSGTINTNNVTIASSSGKMSLTGDNLTLSDGSIVRVKIGADSDGDYTLTLWNADGTMIWDAEGITRDAIPDETIGEDQIEDGAITTDKLAWASVLNQLVQDGVLTSSTTVEIDGTTQTISAWLSSIQSTQTGLASRTQTIESWVQATTTQIATFVTQTDLTTLSNNLGSQISTNYSSLTQRCDSIEADLSSEVTTLEGSISSVQSAAATALATANGYETRVTALETRTYTDTSDYEDIIDQFESTISQTASEVRLEVSEELTETLEDYVSHTELNSWITFDSTGLHIGNSACNLTLNMSADGIVFEDVNGNEVGSWDGEFFHTKNAYIEATKYLRIGDFALAPRSDGHLSLITYTDD